jgi:hypothetical protein
MVEKVIICMIGLCVALLGITSGQWAWFFVGLLVGAMSLFLDRRRA